MQEISEKKRETQLLRELIKKAQADIELKSLTNRLTGDRTTKTV